MSWLWVFLGFVALVILHELGHFIAAKRVGMRVESFFLFFPPKLWSFRRGETEYGVGALPLGGFVKISGMNPDELEGLPEDQRSRAYCSMPIRKRIIVIAAGPVANVIVALALFFAAGLIGGGQGRATIDKVFPGSAAEAAGITAGDRILNAAGQGSSPQDLANAIDSTSCKGDPKRGCIAAEPLRLAIERDGQAVQVQVSPVYNGDEQRLGVLIGSEQTGLSIPAAASYAVNATTGVVSLTAQGIANLVHPSGRAQVSSIVGIAKAAETQIADHDAFRILMIWGLISLSLAIFNLLPILPLDGGHIVVALFERIRGRAPTSAGLLSFMALGTIAILMLCVIGLSNDLG